MKATFNFKVAIDNSNVSVSLDIPEKVEDMNITLMKSIMDITSGIEKKIKKMVAPFGDEQKTEEEPENQKTTEETAETPDEGNENHQAE